MIAARQNRTAAKRSRLRWGILALLFFSTVLNYVDRQTLSLLAPQIQRELRMSDLDYAQVVQLFLIAYTAAYLVVGRITDWLGGRVSLAIFVAWWSLANMAAGFVSTVGQLGAARFFLGLGEAGNYTAAPKTASEWFEPKERAFAVGVYTAGAMVGATIAPPAIGFLAYAYGWRAAFIATGALGFIWLAAWLLVYRRDATPAVAGVALAASETETWRAVLADRRLWALVGARLATDPVWYFYLFWFPKYLADARGLDLLEIARVAWIVYLAADVGSILGGLASGALIRRGWSVVPSRLAVIALAACVAPAGALIATEPSVGWTLTLASLVAFCHLLWQINLGTLVLDLVPTQRVATAFGLVAAGSGLGGILSTPLVGRLVTGGGYDEVFRLMAFLHPLGLLLVLTVLIGWRKQAVPA